MDSLAQATHRPPMPSGDRTTVDRTTVDRTIVITSDSAAQRERYRQYLAEDLTYHYHILEAASGQDAIALYQERQPDVLVLDDCLLDLSSLQVLAELSSLSPPDILAPEVSVPDVSVIVIAAQGNEASAIQALQAGAQDYLFESQITPVSLRLSVSRALQGTKRRQQLSQIEDRLKLAYRSTQSGIWDWDAQTNRAYVSDEYAKIYGLDPDTKYITAEAWLETLHPDDREPTMAKLQQALDKETDHYEAEYRIIHPQLGVRWAYARGQVLFDEAGQAVRAIGKVQDITEQVENKLRLEETQAQLKSALLAGAISTWRYDPAKDVIMGDRTFAKLFQFSREEAIEGVANAQVLARIHPKDRDHTLANFDRAVTTGSAYEVEYRILPPNQKLRWVLDRGQPALDGQGQLVGFTGVLIDITERKREASSRRRSEQRSRQIINSLLSFVGIVSPTGILLEANRTALDAAKLTPEQVIGKPFADAYWWSHDPTVQARLRQAISEANTGKTVRYDEVVRIQQNQLITIDFTLVPVFDEAGQLEFLIPSGIDITDRKQAEQELAQNRNLIRQQLAEIEAIYHTIPIGLTVLDTDLRFQRVNRALAEINGVPPEQHIGRTVREVVPDLADKIEPVLQRILETGEPVLDFEVRGETPAQPGVERIWLESLYPLRDSQHQVTGVNIMAQEITERKQAEQERDRLLTQAETARQAAEAASRVKDEFLAIVSHELRTPLNPILGWSELLQRRQLTAEKTARALAIISRNARNQATLIDDLLDISRILRGKLSLNHKSVQLAAVINAAIETVQLSADAKSIQIHTQLDSPVGQISGDAERLQQIVWNLLSNAIKFTPKGGQVEVQLTQVSQEAQIAIRDTGKGIPKKFLPYVFDRFYQEDATTTRQFGGLGLGLAIVRYLTELHGGTIEAQSSGAEQGATFTLRLPLMPEQAASTPESPQVASAEDLSGLHILVVDDDADAREICSFLLEDMGATVTMASSAVEALAKLRQAPFDVLISDIGMPEMNGYALMRQVRSLPLEQGGEIRAIALTAYASEIDYRRAIEAGFQTHLAKPIKLDQLAQTIINLSAAKLPTAPS